MTLVASFAGVDAKLNRADAHFQVIEKEIHTFLASNPYRFVGEHDSKSGQVVVKARLQVHPDTDYWATVIGDCVHNLRSALDHLAHQLLLLANGVPKVGRSGTAFPIFDSFTEPKGGPRTVGITGVSGKVVGRVLTCVEGVQPRERVNEVNLHPLWVLSELDNMDKHRELALTSLAMDDFSLGIGRTDDISVSFELIGGFTGLFDETTEVIRFKATPTGPNPHMEMYPHGTLDVAFDATNGVAAERPVLTTLMEMSDYVSNIIDVLKVKALKP